MAKAKHRVGKQRLYDVRLNRVWVTRYRCHYRVYRFWDYGGWAYDKEEDIGYGVRGTSHRP